MSEVEGRPEVTGAPPESFRTQGVALSALHNYRSHYVLAVESPCLIRYHRSGLEAREVDATTHFVEGIAAFRQRPGRSDVRKSLTRAKVRLRSRSQAERVQLNLQTQAKECAMSRISTTAIATIIAAGVAVLAGAAISADKYAVQVSGGLAFSEFKGYEDWPLISTSDNSGKFAAILGNPVMMDALRAGVPGNGKPFPDGAKMAKIHWSPKTQEAYPGPPRVLGTQANADFMVKDSKRFADSGGWGWGSFDYDAASDTFTPATEADTPPQGHDASCGLACHSLVKSRDYVFTEYAHR